MPPHQQRVLDERAELAEKHGKLGIFIENSPTFALLPVAEKRRLFRQQTYMGLYLDVLQERIEAF